MRGIVGRHMPLRDGHFAAHRNGEGIWEDQIRHADMSVLCIDLTQRQYAKSKIGGLDVDARSWKLPHNFGHRHRGIDRRIAKQFAVTLIWILVLKKPMQERRVRRINADFERLKPVTVDPSLKAKVCEFGAMKQSKRGNSGGVPGPK